MDLLEIAKFLQQNQEPAFRLKQITKNYLSGRYSTFMEMTDISLPLRKKLNAKYALYSTKPENILKDNFSQKSLLSLSDGLKIESVLMDYQDWKTVCVSCQVGCSLGCKFCATGKMGFKRNLSVEEIIDQILLWKSKNIVSRVVFMGMGEPFLNYDNVIKSAKFIIQDLKIGARKISLSTAGIVPAIIDFANLKTEINLAVSLHSADQNTRESIMPITKQYPLPQLMESLNYYTKTTNRQVFFEYLLARNVNDSPKHLKLLIDFINSNYLFYLNIISLNPVKGGLIPSLNIGNFLKELTKNHVNYSLRQSIGQSINSACGQLITDN